MFVTATLIPVLWVAAAMAFLAASGTGWARDPLPGADSVLTNAPSLPEPFRSARIETNFFADLRAEVIAGRFRVSCRAGGVTGVQLMASAEEPGHWRARDWRPHRMLSNAAGWFVELPVASLRVPIVYFATAQSAAGAVASPFRLASPAALGMEEVTRYFWPFVEGFEQDLSGWKLADGSIDVTSMARSGRAALRAAVPAGHRSVTVTTTRLRGWWMEECAATGIGMWLRTKAGAGTATFSLLANAFTTNQIVARRSEPVPVSSRWTKVQVPLESFPRLPLGDVDLCSIEFAGAPGVEFFVDDVHLTGRWREEF